MAVRASMMMAEPGAGSGNRAEETGITLEHVSVCAGDKGRGQRAEPLLQDIHCHIAAGSITLIAGAAGSGKTTLLQTIAGLTPLSRGAVRYGADSLWMEGGRLHPLHASIGIVFQYPERQLFAESIEKEFRYSLRPYRLSKTVQGERIQRALARMGLPEGILKESFLTLSEGQKRKAALATTLAAEPRWLLLDEPTAGIDPQGIAPLIDCMLEQKAAGGGIVVVSHDLDTFLPIADRLLVLHGGALAAEGTPQELLANPRLWLETGIGLPSALHLTVLLRENGIDCDRIPLTAEEMADRIVERKERAVHPLQAGPTPAAATDGNSAGRSLAFARAESSSPLKAAGPAAKQARTASRGTTARVAAARIVRDLHPIAKWLIYVLLSAAVLMQHSWAGIGAAGLITGGLVMLSGVAYRSLRRPIKPFLYFIVLSVAISGIGITLAPDSWRLERIYFSTEAAAETAGLLIRFLFVMIMGVLLAVTTGLKGMQAAMEQALSFLERLRIPAAPFAFAATMLMRFLPRLFQEMDRMAIIVQARGKFQTRRGALRLRELPVFLIPFLLSMMKYAEDLSLTLESRGYQMKRWRRAGSVPLPWTRREWIGVAAGILLFAVFYMWH
ncbi:ATP-binding cassette domain-containing protein [Paenibacillus oenotherae]|uniref:ATP-binding cassette domain-containing protein n=1 Tax=Paenibacillus oenotherae TaxID=1435645 RepID=A0ABS7D1T9_9BACL|nr:ATP-binding cassette domain-containing protein [Paenibacillus oenotherae]MBW7473153.1 ATP-binding cassette domain-containing protein [Paenibacillus oenotherae]